MCFLRMFHRLAAAGRYAVFLLGLGGLVTSVQTACTFDSPIPERPAKNNSNNKNPVTDSGPTETEETKPSGGTSGLVIIYGNSSGGTYGYYGGYGYGYGPGGCYGYGYNPIVYGADDVYGGYVGFGEPCE